MTVVCNATPLINFAAINRLDILQAMFGQVVIPQAVYNETTGSSLPGSQSVLEAIASGWIQVRTVSAIVPEILAELDDGEREAIALALEMSESRILLDEREARQIAQRLGKIKGNYTIIALIV